MRFFIMVSILAASLTGCAIHRIDVQQGNVIKDDMVKQLTVGMTERQVRFILGSPLIQDPFHKNRWDYIYTLQPGDTRAITERKHLKLTFENDKLASIDRIDLN